MGVVIKWFGSKFYFSTSWDASPRKYQTAELQKQWILIWIPWSSNLSFVKACYLRRHRSYVSCHKTFEIFLYAARQRCAPSLDFPKYSPRPWWLGAKLLSSSDPHPDTLLCIIYIYITHTHAHTHIYIYVHIYIFNTHTYIYICIDAYILTFYLAFFLALYSEFCDWGPAGNALIRSSRLRSGAEYFDPELAVEVRPGTLWYTLITHDP